MKKPLHCWSASGGIRRCRQAVLQHLGRSGPIRARPTAAPPAPAAPGRGGYPGFKAGPRAMIECHASPVNQYELHGTQWWLMKSRW